MRHIILAAFVSGLGTTAVAQSADLVDLMSIPRTNSIQFDHAYRITNDMRFNVKDAWADALYFGAFAEHPSGAFGFSTESNSVAAAEASALRFCADVSNNDGRCRIIARLMPKGLSGDALPPYSPNITDAIIEVQGLNEAGYAAIATAGDGAWGSSLNGRTPEEAMRIAMESCEEWRVSGGETPLEGFPCEIAVVMHSDVTLPSRN